MTNKPASSEEPVIVDRRCRFPIVLDSPHSGVNYPDDFAYSMALETLRRAEDTHVDQLYVFAQELGYPMVAANRS
jgi:N-formylglutamate deformylase